MSIDFIKAICFLILAVLVLPGCDNNGDNDPEPEPCTAEFETIFTGLARNNGGANTDPSVPGFEFTIATGFVQEDQVPLTIQGVGFDITGELLRVGDIRESDEINGISYRLEVIEISIDQSDNTASFVRYTLDRKDCASSCTATYQTVFTGLARNNEGANTDPSVPGFEFTIATGLDTEGIQAPLTIQGVGFNITGALLRVGDIRESGEINGISYRLEVIEISIDPSNHLESFVRYTLDRKDCS